MHTAIQMYVRGASRGFCTAICAVSYTHACSCQFLCIPDDYIMSLVSPTIIQQFGQALYVMCWRKLNSSPPPVSFGQCLFVSHCSLTANAYYTTVYKDWQISCGIKKQTFGATAVFLYLDSFQFRPAVMINTPSAVILWLVSTLNGVIWLWMM